MPIDINLDTSVYKYNKDNTSPNMYGNLFHKTIRIFHNYKHIYSDTFKVENRIAIIQQQIQLPLINVHQNTLCIQL